MDITKLASGAGHMFLGHTSDDEFTDRLNYRYTVGLLLFFTLILSTKQYSSEVIKCWVPAHLIIYEPYVCEVCWVQNTYYFPPNQTIPKEEIEREKSQIKYYQWVSFILLFQAFLFYMPRIFWTSFSGRGGLYLTDLVEAAVNYKAGDKFYKKSSYMEYLVLNIDQFVDDGRRQEMARSQSRIIRILGTSFPCAGRFLGNYILILYMMTKLIYIINTFIQVSLISVFLGQSFWSYGMTYISNLVAGRGWYVSNSKYFPKVTLCDFMIREIGNPRKSHRYTVECVLPVNLFNQQIFTIIWFWYFIVLICNVISLIVWFVRMIPARSKKWIQTRTNLFNHNVNQKLVPRRLEHFLRFYLEPDGIFMIRMIGNNTSDYVATDLIHQLWCQHDEKYGHLFPDEPHQSKRPCTFIHSKDYSPIHKSANHHCLAEDTYHEERVTMYAEKHGLKNIHNYFIQTTPTDDCDSDHDDRKDDQEDVENQQYKNYIRKRLGSLLSEQQKVMMEKKDKKLKRIADLLNATDTNSDESDLEDVPLKKISRRKKPLSDPENKQ